MRWGRAAQRDKLTISNRGAARGEAPGRGWPLLVAVGEHKLGGGASGDLDLNGKKVTGRGRTGVRAENSCGTLDVARAGTS